MNQVELKFYPNQWNPARTPSFGVYRVMGCALIGIPHKPCVIDTPRGPRMLMMVARPYKVRSRVDPVRLALECKAA